MLSLLRRRSVAASGLAVGTSSAVVVAPDLIFRDVSQTLIFFTRYLVKLYCEIVILLGQN
jgi:hypothetical protein